MSRKKKTKLPPFVAIEKRMIESDAFKALSNAARTAYTLLLNEKTHIDQIEVKLPYSTAERFMQRKTFHNAVGELTTLGFVEVAQYGGLYRRTNVYRFLKDWQAIDQAEAKSRLEQARAARRKTRAVKKTVEMADSIRGVLFHPVRNGENVSNKCGNAHRQTSTEGFDGVHFHTVDGVQKHP